MHESNSRDVRYVIVDGDGTVTYLEPLEDADARRTPEERKLLLDYLDRMKEIYQRQKIAREKASQTPSM